MIKRRLTGSGFLAEWDSEQTFEIYSKKPAEGWVISCHEVWGMCYRWQTNPYRERVYLAYGDNGIDGVVHAMAEILEELEVPNGMEN